MKDLEQDFQYWFDDNRGDISIAGITFSASDILKTMDPIAYNQEFNNYVDYTLPLYNKKVA